MKTANTEGVSDMLEIPPCTIIIRIAPIKGMDSINWLFQHPKIFIPSKMRSPKTPIHQSTVFFDFPAIHVSSQQYMYSLSDTCILSAIHVFSQRYMYFPRDTCILSAIHVFSQRYMYFPRDTSILPAIHVSSQRYMYPLSDTSILPAIHLSSQ
jgi:hypothetical protein